MRSRTIPLVSLKGDAVVLHVDGVQAFRQDTVNAIMRDLKDYEPKPQRKRRGQAVHVAPVDHECADMPAPTEEKQNDE